MKTVTRTLLIVLSINIISYNVAAWRIGQEVITTSGFIEGHAAKYAPDVSEYLGVPFAKPPVGHLRFAPPQSFRSDRQVKASRFSPSCPALPLPELTQFPKNLSVNGFKFTPSGVKLFRGTAQAGDRFSEDCLTVNVWTKPQMGEKQKAVMVWIYGGGFQFGTSSTNLTTGEFLASEHDVVVVTFNYRLGIFGFPGNPAGSNNLGLLDQRLAIEWVRDNIEAFGGDHKRIMIFGESAGGVSVDYYAFAYTKDPIVSSFIAQSGNVFTFASLPASISNDAWFNATGKLQCGGNQDNPNTVLECMRSKPYSKVLRAATDVLFAYPKDVPLGIFAPTIDNTIVFSDYGSRAASGNFIRKPFFVGNNDYETGFQKAVYALEVPNGSVLPPDYFWDAYNDLSFECSSARRAYYSYKNGVPTWRYRYFGAFENLQLTSSPDSRAYHTAEIPMIFNTVHGFGPNTNAQQAIGEEMRRAWTNFAKNPQNGLPQSVGWPSYAPSTNTLLRIAYSNRTGANRAYSAKYDYLCPFITSIGGSDGLTIRTFAKGNMRAYEQLEGLKREDLQDLLSFYKI